MADTSFHPAWSRQAVIYEVNVRQFSREGTLAAVEAQLPRLKALGVDILWLMPVQPIGVKNRKGPLGSYYAIRDYTAVNPEFGTEADVRRLVDAAHRQGMRVILDWVANHTAFDHPWIAQHPDWYVRNAKGQIINARDNENNDTDWTDVAELDYAKRPMRDAMLAAMRWWVERVGIDGFRCDVAGGTPTSFWVEAHDALDRANPDLFWLAESEDPGIHAAFDMTYGWELHQLLNAVGSGKRPASDLAGYFAKQDRTFGRGAYRMYFTSNHDENSWNGTEMERMGANHQPAYVLAATVANGMPLLYTGQEVPVTRRLKFFEKDPVDWSAGTSLAPFYRRLFDLKHAQPALGNGPWGAPQVELKTSDPQRVFAFSRSDGTNTVVVAVNFGDRPARAAYTGFARPGTYTEWFTNAPVALDAAGTLEVPAHGWRVYVR
jgi:glycosidase